MLSMFTSGPLTKIDGLEAVRAAKAAIQGGQQQQASRPVPPRPSQAQLPRPTPGMSVDSPVVPMIGANSSGSGAGT
jgi:hypothetical protein